MKKVLFACLLGFALYEQLFCLNDEGHPVHPVSVVLLKGKSAKNNCYYYLFRVVDEGRCNDIDYREDELFILRVSREIDWFAVDNNYYLHEMMDGLRRDDKIDLSDDRQFTKRTVRLSKARKFMQDSEIE